MSGVGEAVAVVACVAALITAYKDGDGIVQQIKERRRKRNTLPPTDDLEESLQKGQREIESTARDGYNQFGDGFKTGDDIAVQQLKDVTIAVQASLLRNLHEAVMDDNMTDFSPCINAATKARLQAINILNDLYVRQLERASAQRPLAAPPLGPAHPATQQNVQNEPERYALHNVPSRSSDESSRKSNTFRFSWKVQGRNSANRAEGLTATHPPNHQSGSLGQPESHGFVSPTQQRPGTYTYPPQTPPQGQINIHPQDPQGRPSDYASQLPPPLAQPLSAPVPSRRSTVPAKSASANPAPSFRGFCKSAYYLQASLDSNGLKVGSQSVAMTGSNHAWFCKNNRCAFEGRACKDSQGHWSYDDTVGVYAAEDGRVLNYRWLFLAKSHVQQGRIKPGKGQFRCFFCALNSEGGGERGKQQGDGEVYEGRRALLDHVLQHCGEICGGFRLVGPLRIRPDKLVEAAIDAFDVCFQHDSTVELDSNCLVELPG